MHSFKCLAGCHNEESGEMALEMCTTVVGSHLMFQNSDTKHKFHPYKDYVDIYPEWTIRADLSLKTSLYWKWFIGHYDSEIANAFVMKKATVPYEWKKLRWSDVKKSLKDSFNL